MDKIYPFDSVVIGGGVIGLAIACELQLIGQKVLLVEKNKFLSEETSSRNSGVIHSGIYYPKDSLKKIFCIRGNHLLYRFCKKNEVPHVNTGKLIVAKKEEEKELISIFNNGLVNGLSGEIELVDENKIRKLEPNISKDISLAINVKSSGIVDQPSFCSTLQSLFEKNGGQIILNTTFYNYKNVNSFHISSLDTLNEKFKVKSKNLIICSGLHSYELGLKINEIKSCNRFSRLKYVKGHYFKLSNKKPPFKKLIYPIPNKLGLGIHYTLDMNGFGKFGPDTEVVDEIEYTFKEKNLKEKFLKRIQQYWSEIRLDNLNEDYAGIRPKLDIKKEFVDFSILDSDDHGLKNLLFLQGIDSPGLTSSLAISEYVSQKLI